MKMVNKIKELGSDCQIRSTFQGRNQDSNLGGIKFFVQKFYKIKISILDIDKVALLALI